ncbi:MAG: hypothetical protein ACE15C_18340 [Phycisphaerae bacterium]
MPGYKDLWRLLKTRQSVEDIRIALAISPSKLARLFASKRLWRLIEQDRRMTEVIVRYTAANWLANMDVPTGLSPLLTGKINRYGALGSRPDHGSMLPSMPGRGQVRLDGRPDPGQKPPTMAEVRKTFTDIARMATRPLAGEAASSDGRRSGDGRSANRRNGVTDPPALEAAADRPALETPAWGTAVAKALAAEVSQLAGRDPKSLPDLRAGLALLLGWITRNSTSPRLQPAGAAGGDEPINGNPKHEIRNPESGAVPSETGANRAKSGRIGQLRAAAGSGGRRAPHTQLSTLQDVVASDGGEQDAPAARTNRQLAEGSAAVEAQSPCASESAAMPKDSGNPQSAPRPSPTLHSAHATSSSQLPAPHWPPPAAPDVASEPAPGDNVRALLTRH